MKFKYLTKINSTNNYCKKNIDNLDDKTVVHTSNQTNGRGRFNRVWIDLGTENIFMSIVLKPSKDLKSVYSNLTQYTALKLAETFAKYNVESKIKWPNDILIKGKKISGILAETVIRNNELKGIIIGIGINLNANEKDFSNINKPVTALNLETKTKIDKEKFLNNFTNTFFKDYEIFLKKGFLYIKSEYENNVNFLGKEITIQNLNETITGIAEKITDDGAIVINGKEFFTGDIL